MSRYVVMAGLKLFVDWSSLELTEIYVPLPPKWSDKRLIPQGLTTVISHLAAALCMELLWGLKIKQEDTVFAHRFTYALVRESDNPHHPTSIIIWDNEYCEERKIRKWDRKCLGLRKGSDSSQVSEKSLLENCILSKTLLHRIWSANI